MAKRYEDRYGRGGYRRDRERGDDRGHIDRAGDEMRSWFGDDDAQRRRSMDEYREHELERRPDWNRGESNRSDWNRGDSNRGDWNRGQWNREETRRAEWNSPDWSRQRSLPNRPENWRGQGGGQSMRNQSDDRSWSGSDWDRNWDRNRATENYGERGFSERGYGEVDRSRDYGRSDARPQHTRNDWSVDEGRTEFGQQGWGRGPKGYQRSDARILEDVCDRLTYSEVDAGEIEVRVENGEVTLSGSVRDRGDKRRAEDVAEEVSGVRDVHNNIRVHRADRGIGQSDTSASEQPGTVLGVNPTESSAIANARPKAKT